MEMSSDDLEHADINSREEDLPLSRLIFEENRLKSIRFGYEGLPYAGQLPMEIELKFNGHAHILGVFSSIIGLILFIVSIRSLND